MLSWHTFDRDSQFIISCEAIRKKISAFPKDHFSKFSRSSERMESTLKPLKNGLNVGLFIRDDG